MSAFVNETRYSTATASPSHSFDVPSRKSYDKTPVGNAFLYTTGLNGDSGYLEPHQAGDHQLLQTLKAGSAPSLNGARSSIGSYSRDRIPSKNESTPSLGSGLNREPKEPGRTALWPDGPAMDRSTDASNGADSALSSSGPAPLINGNSTRAGSSSLKPTVNGDSRLPTDDFVSFETDPSATGWPLSTSAPENALQPLQEPHRLFPPIQRSHHRYSSPPAPSTADSHQSLSSASKSQHRHTLQVPKVTPGRKNSRDLSDESTAYSSGLLSPSGASLRRTSASLVRRTTRSGQSDLHSEDAPPDEDAARWTEAIKQKRAWKKRREEEDDERVIVGTKVDQNHGNWVTAYNMLTGIRFVVSRVNAKMERELTPADFEAKHKFSFDITGNELTPSAKYDFKFKDYAPWVFRSLRAKFKLDPADYLMSLTSKYILSELGSPGKSGSFFYFSRDYKYIIKTIHHGEHKLLRKILPDYYQHIEQNPNTLISQFYGLHRVKMAYGRKIHFVVMNNLFPPHRDIHQMFDLKGSTVGRDLREEDLVNNPRATMKDLNWLRRQRHIELGPMKRGVFLAQLKRDVTLLQRLNIMDYSLLIGIHDVTRGNEEKLRDKTLQVFQPGGDREEDPIANLLTRTPSKLENMRKARELRLTLKKERPVPLERTGAKMPDEILDERKNLVFYSDDGGFRATHENGQPGDEIYYLGVIDCLTHYGMLKKAETFWKGLSHNRAQISPIPSHSYGDRFMNFIEEITMSKEEAERRQQTRDQGSASQDISRSSLGFRRSSVERSMQQVVEKEPARDGLEPHSRTLMAVRDTTDPTTTLPVVEEAGEAGSTGSEKNPLNGGQSLEEPRDGDRERWVNSADHVGNFSYLSDAQRLAPTSKKGKGREMVYIPGGPTFQHSR